jgi:hypothetical protein
MPRLGQPISNFFSFMPFVLPESRALAPLPICREVQA